MQYQKENNSTASRNLNVTKFNSNSNEALSSDLSADRPIFISGHKMEFGFPKIEKNSETGGKNNPFDDKTVKSTEFLSEKNVNKILNSTENYSNSKQLSMNKLFEMQVEVKDLKVKSSNFSGTVRSNIKLDSVKMQIYKTSLNESMANLADNKHTTTSKLKRTASLINRKPTEIDIIKHDILLPEFPMNIVNNGTRMIKPLIMRKPPRKIKLDTLKESEDDPKKLKIISTTPKVATGDNKSQNFNEINMIKYDENKSFILTNSNQNTSRDVIKTPRINEAIEKSEAQNLTKDKSKPDIAVQKAIFKPKTPILYSPDKILRDVKTPVGLKFGRWSPIKLKTEKKLYDRLHLDETLKELENLFHELDKDRDGHLNFDIVENAYCKDIKDVHKSFFRQIYEILSESTFFGLKEFKSFVFLIEQFKKFNSKNTNYYWDYFNDSDFEDYVKEIREFLKLIDSVDLSKEYVKVEDVMKAKIKDFESSFKIANKKNNMDFNKMSKELKMEIDGENAQIKLVNFILMIPLYIHLESIFKNKSLYKRHQYSIINMKEASNFHNLNKRY